MRLTKLSYALVIAFAAILLAVTPLTAQQKNPLTNADVIKMVKAGMAESAITAAIAASDTQFDLSSTGLQTLGQAGVSSKVIRAMLAAESKKKDAAAAAEKFDACAVCSRHTRVRPGCVVRNGVPRDGSPGDAAGNVTGSDAADAANDEQHAS